MSATGIRVLPADQRTPAALAAHTHAEVQRWAQVFEQAGRGEALGMPWQFDATIRLI